MKEQKSTHRKEEKKVTSRKEPFVTIAEKGTSLTSAVISTLSDKNGTGQDKPFASDASGGENRFGKQQ